MLIIERLKDTLYLEAGKWRGVKFSTTLKTKERAKSKESENINIC
jgi:hypothetical protein